MKYNRLLTSLSVLFLIGFLLMYISKTYQEAEESLQNELEVSLYDINRKIKKNQLKDVFLFINDTLKADSPFFDDTVSFHTDTIKFTTTLGKKVVMEQKKPTSEVSVFVSKNEDNQKIKQAGIYVRKGVDSLKVTELLFDLNTIEFVDSMWSIALQKKSLPSKFKIAKVDQSYESDSFYVVVQNREFLNEGKFIATFSDHHWYLIKKIAPQILLSSLLFSMVCAAFFFSAKTIKEQEKIGKLKNDFISNMTHELKTPISTVGVAIEAMQSFNVLSSPDKTKEYLSIAGNELNRLTILVDKVLKMSQFESTSAPMGKVTVNDFDEIIKNVSKSMQIQFSKSNAILELDIRSGNYKVLGDQVHLSNIIYNLMDNALKYSSKNPKVIIKLFEKSEEILFSIKDNGIGIPAEYQSKIFDQFFRVPTGNIHNVKGYGLGLNYVEKVVRAHKGVIKLKSVESGGTEFLIELPKHA